MRILPKAAMQPTPLAGPNSNYEGTYPVPELPFPSSHLNGDRDPQSFHEGLPDTGGELRTTVRHDVLRDPVVPEDVREESLRGLQDRREARQKNQMTGFGKPVHNDQDGGVPLQGAKVCDKVHREMGPGMLCNWERVEFDIGEESQCLALCSGIAGRNVNPGILGQGGPPVFGGESQ